jgi:hypothetical protein
MSGVQLLELGASDLVDVLHFMYETDLFAASADMQEAKDSARSVIYEQMYEREYIYSTTQTRTQDYSLLEPPLNDGDDEPLPRPLDPKSMSKKPAKAFTPATKFYPDAVNPYIGVLDAPLG